jgi:hypothetical protein
MAGSIWPSGLGDGSQDVFAGLAGGALPETPSSFVVSRDDIDLGYFFAIRHLNSVGVEGYWTGLKQGIPLTPPVNKSPPPR